MEEPTLLSTKELEQLPEAERAAYVESLVAYSMWVMDEARARVGIGLWRDLVSKRDL